MPFLVAHFGCKCFGFLVAINVYIILEVKSRSQRIIDVEYIIGAYLTFGVGSCASLTDGRVRRPSGILTSQDLAVLSMNFLVTRDKGHIPSRNHSSNIQTISLTSNLTSGLFIFTSCLQRCGKYSPRSFNKLLRVIAVLVFNLCLKGGVLFEHTTWNFRKSSTNQRVVG